jgi:hypothetical protein
MTHTEPAVEITPEPDGVTVAISMPGAGPGVNGPGVTEIEVRASKDGLLARLFAPGHM